jgi:hypothetical protein
MKTRPVPKGQPISHFQPGNTAWRSLCNVSKLVVDNQPGMNSLRVTPKSSPHNKIIMNLLWKAHAIG